MKKLFLLVFTFVLTFSLYAQSEKGYVHLKNGSIIKGKYWYSGDLKKINVESAGNLWIFNSNEIDSVVSLRPGRVKNIQNEQSFSRFLLHSEVGVLLGNDDNNQTAPFSFTTSVNYALTEKAAAGLGLGVELLDESYLPVYVNFEYKFRNTSSTPFVFFKTGYQISLEDSRKVRDYYYYPYWSSFAPWPDYQVEKLEPKGGVMINAGVGYQRMYSPSFGMSVAFGYQYHRLNYDGENEYSLDVDYNRLTLRLGIIFN